MTIGRGPMLRDKYRGIGSLFFALKQTHCVSVLNYI